MERQNSFRFQYQFQFEDGYTKNYHIALDPKTLSLIPDEHRHKPQDWTHLKYKQCSNCSLVIDSHPFCPIAVNIMELVETFKDVLSYQNCTVVCETEDRTYSKNTSIMEGLSAIFGVIMATSDCPIMNFLKPMARFHLPFASVEETTVRTTSMYLLGQYFRHKDQTDIKMDFKTLENHYAQVKLVNEGVIKRISSVSKKDADKNAIVTLHSLSLFLSMEIDYSLSSLEYIFITPYINE
ncbi:MAG: hypothetical protein JRE28_11160 [Deltaproteobacteria bacterium]|nr:hypothetical protein [Deltaproteobacteria bacterium]